MSIAKKLVIAVLAVAPVGALIVAVWLNSMSHRRAVAVREYEAQGFQMVKFCNGGAANDAQGAIYTIKQYLEDFSADSVKDTNMIAQLERALVVAQEKAKVLNEDCLRRGHCHTYPCKTNWVVINEALKAAEQSYR